MTLPAAPSQTLGDVVPDMRLPALGTGQTRSLDECLAGHRGALVVFWSSVCSHCVRYDAYFNRFAAAHPEIALYIVATRQGETVVEIQRAVADRRLTFALYHSPDAAAAAAYLAQQTPRVYLVDRERRLLYRGAIDNFKYPSDPEYQAYLEPAITGFLAGRPIERPETSSFGCAVASVYYVLPRMITRASSHE